MTTSYVIDAARTPRGRGKAGKGALSGIHPQELFAQILGALHKRGSFEAATVDDVMVGCVSQAGLRLSSMLTATCHWQCTVPVEGSKVAVTARGLDLGVRLALPTTAYDRLRRPITEPPPRSI